jgi:phenylpropionate dioxygenase-like ring-hydroxylating dioxygenase large terminal subunit
LGTSRAARPRPGIDDGATRHDNRAMIEGVPVAVGSGRSPIEWTDPDAWSRTRTALPDAGALRAGAYTDQHFFELERERVFEQSWVCVATADEIAGPGRLLVRTVGDRSVLITRNVDGGLRGFLNACRHRGTELAEADCDVARTIRCPYHRWGYSLDGELVATPFFDEELRDEFDRADFGLVPVRIDAWGPLVFACLSPHTPPLSVWLGDLPDRMAGYGLDSWVTRHEQDVEIAANWKLISENFQEYYHLTWVHPELAKVSRVADHHRYQGHGMYCGQTTTPVSGDERDDWLSLPEAPDLDASDAVSGRFVAIFPNVLMSVLPNHAWIMRLEPLGPETTREVCTMMLPGAPVADGALAPTLQFWLEVNQEDIDIVERGQRGLSRGGAPPGPLAPRFEEPLHRFHNMLADHMTADPVDGGIAHLVVPAGDRPGVATDRWGAPVNPTPPAIEQRCADDDVPVDVVPTEVDG